MGERGQRPRLAPESLTPVGVADEGRCQDFQRDVPIELCVSANFSHPGLVKGQGAERAGPIDHVSTGDMRAIPTGPRSAG
jgi:hypothetical protein